METRDKNYDIIEVGMNVELPDPDPNRDDWNHSFVGYVESIDLDGYLSIEDGDGDFFTVECERVEIIPS